jgi:hypothetical protein
MLGRVGEMADGMNGSPVEIPLEVRRQIQRTGLVDSSLYTPLEEKKVPS